MKCPVCIKVRPNPESLKEHLIKCSGRVHYTQTMGIKFNRFESFKPKPRRISKNSKYWIQNCIRVIPVSEFLMILRLFHQKQSIEQWKLRKKRPANTLILDCEYNIRYLKLLKDRAVFQIAIANAKGEWVVPCTTINHRVPKRDLRELFELAFDHLPSDIDDAQRKSSLRRRRTLVKFYGLKDFDSETSG